MRVISSELLGRTTTKDKGDRTHDPRHTKAGRLVKWAEPAAVEKAAETWSDDYVDCRINGHNWSRKHQTVHRYGTGFVITQKCPTCKNQREMEMDSRGYGQKWHMKYAEGYLLKNMGRVDQDGRAVLRLAGIRNAKIIEEPMEEAS